MTKGIKLQKDKPTELMVVGNMTYKAGKYLIDKPELVIGSDRMELYEHFARRREVMVAFNRNWMKLAGAATLAHFVVVQIPTIFSRYFGDEPTAVEKSLGSKDLSETGLKMSRLKGNMKRNELQ